MVVIRCFVKWSGFVLAAWVCGATPATAQMNFSLSTYSDAYTDGSSVIGYVDEFACQIVGATLGGAPLIAKNDDGFLGLSVTQKLLHERNDWRQHRRRYLRKERTTPERRGHSR